MERTTSLPTELWMRSREISRLTFRGPEEASPGRWDKTALRRRTAGCAGERALALLEVVLGVGEARIADVAESARACSH